MENRVKQLIPKKCRKNERGAALVTVLMISVLLFVAAAALLLEASVNTANMTDATAEEQAYYAAESGIQTVINVLRGNTVANPLIDPSKPATDQVNSIDYVKAVKLTTSNISGDTSTDARLSRWLNYGTGSFTDRIILGDTNPSTYTARNGFAYKVAVTDPDNLDNKLSYYTSGIIDNGTSSKTWTGSPSNLTIEYLSTTVTDLPINSSVANTNFGKFRITGSGTIPTRVRFAITVNMTKPYSAVKVIRGFIEAGTVTSASVGSVRLFYDSEVFIVLGSAMTLFGGNRIAQTAPTIRYGYEVLPKAPLAVNLPDENLGETLIKGSITLPEPTRLLIRSTGLGPRGATKQLEAVIYKNYFDGLGAPATLLLIGPPNVSFGAGSSNRITYSGLDTQKKADLPPIGVTNDTNLARINLILRSFSGDVFGTASNVGSELPPWLQTPTALHATLNKLKEVADASGRYFGPGGVPPPPMGNGNYGDPITGKGITFIDGDLEFSQEGGGILVVTGDLKIRGGFEWNGLMIITGAGGMDRSGGGNGTLQGNMIIAPYNKNSLGNPNILLDGYLPPKYTISGGGNSTTAFNSNKVDAGLTALSNFVKGVAEK